MFSSNLSTSSIPEIDGVSFLNQVFLICSLKAPPSVDKENKICHIFASVEAFAQYLRQ